ncbi:hypothetical protein [Telmatospirillum sp.]|uniref:hypothetical protein n=1 Tax=Telmatospirillum sp. TaxID=2079197 RepID=UPI0028421D10|nr:hypothetical protein [Telmatospirillum sp.]MDR3440559.1 hypothetical protein [Telmatospirillum sp.]
MIYLSWAAMHEGATDRAYFDILIPLVMEDLVRRRGTCEAIVPQAAAVEFDRSGRLVDAVAADICREQEAFHLMFIHADTGGRALEADMAHRSEDYRDAAFELCGFPLERCIVIAPRHETEAWMLADRNAVGGALGYRGDLAALGLPASAQDAERLVDPKAILNAAISIVRGRRTSPNVQQLIPAIAQRQDLAKLRGAASYRAFEEELAQALLSLGCID